MIRGTIDLLSLIFILCSIIALILFRIPLFNPSDSKKDDEKDKPKPEEDDEEDDEEGDDELDEDIREEIRDLSKKPQTEDIKSRIKGLEDLLRGRITPAKPPVPLYDKDKGD